MRDDDRRQRRVVDSPLGMRSRGSSWVFEWRFDAAFGVRFPLWTVAVTLVTTVIVMRFPLQRAVHLAPGVALRYE